MSERGIKVVCRFRPQNKIEDGKGGTCCVEFLSDTMLKVAEHEFAFDRVFDGTCTQEQVYEQVRPAVHDLIEGYNATIFAYGQTSSGKTFTMQGPDIDNRELRGIIPRIVEDIFDTVASASASCEFTIRASYLEIYLEKIRDLLCPEKDNLKIREDKARGIYVQDMTEVYVQNTKEVFEVIRVGQHNRSIAATGMNAQSSRSHSVFVLSVTTRNTKDMSSRSGRLYLVDLAGSEKVGKTGAAGLTLNEAKMINKSLSALGLVIKALTEGKGQHVPYRDSKLTRILQESLGGNSRTTLIINCSPSSYNEDETLSTLRFGSRAKTIKNKVKANVERSPAELKALLEKAEAEIAQLKAIIASLQGGGALPDNLLQALAGSSSSSSSSSSSLASSSSQAGGVGGGVGEKESGAALKFTEKLEGLQKELEAAQDERTRLLDTLDGVRDTVSEKTTELEQNVKTIAELREANARLMTENVGLQTKVSETKQQLNTAEVKYNESLAQIGIVAKDLARTREELDSLRQFQTYSSAMNSVGPMYSAASGGIAQLPHGAYPGAHQGQAPPPPDDTRDWSSVELDIRETLQSGFDRFKGISEGLSQTTASSPFAGLLPPATSPPSGAAGALADGSQQASGLQPSTSPSNAASTTDGDGSAISFQNLSSQQRAELSKSTFDKMSEIANLAYSMVEEVVDEDDTDSDDDSDTDSDDDILDYEAMGLDTDDNKDNKDNNGGKDKLNESESEVEIVNGKEGEKAEEEIQKAIAEREKKLIDEHKEELKKESKRQEQMLARSKREKEEAIKKVSGEYEKRLAALEQENKRLRDDLAHKAKEAEIARGLKQELDSVKQRTEEKLAEMARLRDSLVQDLENKCIQSISLQEDLDEMYKKYEELRDTKIASHEKVLRRQLTDKQRTIDKLTQDIADAKLECLKLEDYTEMLQKKVNIRLEYERILTRDIEALREELKMEKLCSADLRNKLDILKSPRPAPATISMGMGGRISKPIRGGNIQTIESLKMLTKETFSSLSKARSASSSSSSSSSSESSSPRSSRSPSRSSSPVSENDDD